MSWKITLHWTAGTNSVSALDKQHYHFIVDGNAVVHEGRYKPEDNINTSSNYAAHALGANTKNIGVSLAGMSGASESPLNYGKYPITQRQFLKAIDLIAELVKKYNITVSPKTVLTHAEIEPNLGIAQRGKWDITVLPWDPSIRGAKPIGDFIRSLVRDRIGNQPQVTPTVSTIQKSLVKIGDKGELVRYLQERLNALGYNVGKVDGDFGRLTDAQVRLFQRDNGLVVDGKVGNNTWSKL